MAIALVANVSRAGDGTTAAIDTTGATLIVMAQSFTTSGSVPTKSDSKSNIWSLIGSIANSGGIELYAAFNPIVGAGHTFTAASGFSCLAVAAFSGVSPTFAFEQQKQAGATGTSLQAGSITPSENNCLVVAALGDRATGTIAIDGGFTITDQQTFSSGVRIGVCLAYLVQTTAAAANPSFSWTGSVVATATIANFREPAAPSGGGGGSYAWVG